MPGFPSIDDPAGDAGMDGVQEQFRGQAARVMTEAERDTQRLLEDRWVLHHAGIIEIAVRNANVAEYMRHWEGRAEKAEAAMLALKSES